MRNPQSSDDENSSSEIDEKAARATTVSMMQDENVAGSKTADDGNNVETAPMLHASPPPTDTDEDNEESSLSPQETRVSELEQQVALLANKCDRLEAQNILVSAQQLDIFARVLAVLLLVVTAFWYWRLVWWTVQSLLARYASTTTLPTAAAFTVVKYLLMAVPVLHHKLTMGLAHRRFHVFGVFLVIMVRIKLVRWRETMFATNNKPADSSNNSSKVVSPFGENLTEDALWEANYEVTAHFLYISIFRLRGLWTKSAQYLSSRADFMPLAYVRELKKLQDEAPATAWCEIEKLLQQAPSVLLEQVTDIEQEPIASASIGQVHVAKLVKTGEKVVVKVQHPHARTLLTDDFRSLVLMAMLVSWLEPEYAFFEVLMREWAVEARKELNFLTEAANLRSAYLSIQQMTRTFGDAATGLLRTNSSDSCPEPVSFSVEIPQPYMHLCTRDILVMTFSEGVRMDAFDQIDEWKIPKAAMMDAMGQAFANLMYTSFTEDNGRTSSIFSGDPHVGNQLIRPGTSACNTTGFTIVLLDWGLAKRLSEQKRLAFCQMAYAAATFDFGLMLDAFTTIGLKLKREDVAEDMEGIRFLLRDMAPRDKARKRIKAKNKTDIDRMKSRKKGEKIPMESKAYPGEFFFFVRTNELLHGLGARLAVEMPYLDVIRPYAERGLQQSSVYSDEAEKLAPVHVAKDTTLNQIIQDTVDKLDLEQKIAGAQVCVLDRDGEILANVVGGHMGGLKSALPMRPDALILGYSCTKAIAATLAHVMVEQGYLTYDEPVCKSLWPEFCPTEHAPAGLAASLNVTEAEMNERWTWKRTITLRHILTHTSGLWSALPSRMSIKRMASCESCVEAFEFNSENPHETLLPTREPGEKSEYHYMSFGWLVAGTLCGAYQRKHQGAKLPFEQVYENFLVPKLSKETLLSGFRPCGGGEGFSMALTEADVSASRLLQLQREAKAMGETSDQAEGAAASDASSKMREAMKGKEFLMDPRIWNCGDAVKANVPAAGGRFSATALAYFYRDLGTSGQILSAETLDKVSRVAAIEHTANDLQGQTSMSNDQTEGLALGLGYQLISMDGETEPAAFGHAGVGGSIGFLHKESGVSVAVMLNKADGERDTAKTIVKAIAHHFEWQRED